MYQRSTKLQMWDPKSPEYALLDSMVSEKFTAHSPEIKWWSFLQDNETGAAVRDELDKVYGEKSSGGKDAKRGYLGPFDVKAIMEINPIVKEFTRLGLQQIEEVETFANIAAMEHYLEGRLPKPGDIFRVSWIVTETERRYVFYKVANATPCDPYNFRYINWHISAQQTNLFEAPDTVKLYHEGE